MTAVGTAYFLVFSIASIRKGLVSERQFLNSGIVVHDYGIVRLSVDFDAHFLGKRTFRIVRRVDVAERDGVGLEPARRNGRLSVSEGSSGDHEHRDVSDDRRRSFVGHRSVCLAKMENRLFHNFSISFFISQLSDGIQTEFEMRPVFRIFLPYSDTDFFVFHGFPTFRCFRPVRRLVPSCQSRLSRRRRRFVRGGEAFLAFPRSFSRQTEPCRRGFGEPTGKAELRKS